jgi:hypothetical protein
LLCFEWLTCEEGVDDFEGVEVGGVEVFAWLLLLMTCARLAAIEDL